MVRSFFFPHHVDSTLKIVELVTMVDKFMELSLSLCSQIQTMNVWSALYTSSQVSWDDL